ncbi:MAG TPA: aldolase/citrate lyase family protein [Aestuariivirgaceae bacterium]|jgi:4-hydroxy-2-oxoheptanedioate aldolase
MARSEFGAVAIDMQHGLMDFGEAVSLVQVALAYEKAPIVRVPLEGWGTAGRLLDVGAQGIVMPMVNTPQDARRLVSFTKYPPVGERSWGSYAATSISGMAPSEYLQKANNIVMAFAMVETRQALEAVDAICATAGLDGVFVGPSDLSISLTNGRSNDTQLDETQQAIGTIAKAAKKANIICGIYCANMALARRYLSLGYTYFPVGSDAVYLGRGIEQILKE